MSRWAEREYGLQVVQTKADLRQKGIEPGQQPSVTDGTFQQVRHTGRMPFAEIVKDSGTEAIGKAMTWAEAEENLKAKGLRFEPSYRNGTLNGLVLTDGTEKAAASSLGRDFGMGALGRRFGQSFEDHAAGKVVELKNDNPQPTRTPQKDGELRRQHPMAQMREKIWNRYTDVRAEARAKNNLEWRQFKEERREKEAQQWKELRASQWERRQVIYDMTHRGLLRESLLAVNRGIDNWQSRKLKASQAKERDNNKFHGSAEVPKWKDFYETELKVQQMVARVRAGGSHQEPTPTPKPEIEQVRERLAPLTKKWETIVGKEKSVLEMEARAEIKALREDFPEIDKAYREHSKLRPAEPGGLRAMFGGAERYEREMAEWTVEDKRLSAEWLRHRDQPNKLERSLESGHEFLAAARARAGKIAPDLVAAMKPLQEREMKLAAQETLKQWEDRKERTQSREHGNDRPKGRSR